MSQGLILNANGQPQRTIAPPTPGTAADFFHRTAIAAAGACNDEGKTAKELGVLTDIAQTSAMCRDLLTQRGPATHSHNVVYTYLLAGQVDSGDCRGALLRLAVEHQLGADRLEEAIDTGTGPGGDGMPLAARNALEQQRDNALALVACADTWAGLCDDEPRADPARQVLLYTTLLHNVLQYVARTGPQLFPLALRLGAEAMILAAPVLPEGQAAADAVARRRSRLVL